jgi:hypothetical protein
LGSAKGAESSISLEALFFGSDLADFDLLGRLSNWENGRSLDSRFDFFGLLIN